MTDTEILTETQSVTDIETQTETFTETLTETETDTETQTMTETKPQSHIDLTGSEIFLRVRDTQTETWQTTHRDYISNKHTCIGTP